VGWGVGSGIGSVDARSRPWASGDDPLYILSCMGISTSDHCAISQ
jgi:hypothetical protein